ncbi:MAG TPA: DUF2505 family protein [Acidimicrobiales bacterium]|nr:DUF2505 family protein [Acidimicrobiales bacterium]
MRFTVEQAVAAPRQVAEEALVDPDFYATMGAIGPIGTPEVLQRADDGTHVRLSVRYRFTGHLAAPARRVLDPAKMTWVIESSLDRQANTVGFVMVPDHYGDRLECRGTYRFEDRGDHTAQVVQGDLVVHVPLVGRAVEHAILMGLRQHLAEEAQLIAAYAGRHS